VEEQVPTTQSGARTDLSRRDFIQRSAAVAGGAMLMGLAVGVPGLEAVSAAPEEAHAAAALSADELATLKAVLSRLLPADDLGAGAVEANVHVFIDRALAGAYAALLPLYRLGLAAINKAANGSFAALSAPQQDSLLQEVEAGKVGGPSSASFFQVVLEHMRQGMFGDPMYGGNAQYAGWDLIGYPGVKVAYSANEQEIGTHIAPAHTSAAAFGGHPYP
jgi:gluconate 2-dehydrogenase gamma chain